MSYPPPPPPPPPGEYGYGGYGSTPPETNKKAMWSMILGIVGLVCCGILAGVPALVLGNMAKKEIAASNGTQTGQGMATAGVVLGVVAIVWTVVLLVMALMGVNLGVPTS